MTGRQFMLAVLVAAAALPSSALPSSAREQRTTPRADVSIREMVSFHSKDFVYRALKGDSEIYPFIILRLGETEGDETVLVASWSARDMKGGNVLDDAVEGDDFRDLRWNRGELRFMFYRAGRLLPCVVSGVEAGAPAVSCAHETLNRSPQPPR